MTTIACALIATSLVGCAHSDGAAPVSQLAPSIRISLPDAPAGVAECLHKEFPDIPDRALTRRDVIRIVGEAKVLDRTKTACGDRAVNWIETVLGSYARAPGNPAP